MSKIKKVGSWQFLLSLFFFATAGAQVAVKFYSEEPTNHPNRALSIPTNAVSHVIFTNAAPAGYVLMSTEAYHEHLKTIRPAFREWFENIYEPWARTNAEPSPTVVSNRQANIQALKDLVDAMESAETNWAGLTTAQVKDVVHTHNQAFLRLRPLLRDLYRKYLSEE